MKRVDLKKILYMDFLIRHKCTGTSKEFAAKMDMSRSTLFEYIAYMRDELEVCILFDKFLGTYYYDGKNLYIRSAKEAVDAIEDRSTAMTSMFTFPVSFTRRCRIGSALDGR